MSRRFRALAALALIMPLAACGFTAPAPKRLPPPPAPAPPLSTLSASLSIPAGEIARILDAKTENHLADVRDREVKCAIGRCRLTLLATREGPIETNLENGRFALEVPFGIDADMTLPGFLSIFRATGNAEGIAQADTMARVGHDWQLRTSTDAHVQLEKSHLRVGPISANMTDVLNNNEEIFARPLSRQIDREIEKNVHLRAAIERAWARAFVPIKVAKKPIAWLALTPERLRLSGPSMSDGALKLQLALDVRARVLMQDKPPASAATPLPPPAAFKGPENRFTFVVPATISYADAARLALKSLEKKPLKVGDMTLRFTKLDILPSRDDVVVAAGFCIDQSWDPTGLFSSCGAGYLRGVPVLDAASDTIEITHVHYDVLTENAMLAVMRAVAGPELARALEGRLHFNVGRDLAKLRGQVAAALAKPQGRDVTIAGTIESFGQPKLAWTTEGFLALFSASGTVHLDLHV